MVGNNPYSLFSYIRHWRQSTAVYIRCFSYPGVSGFCTFLGATSIRKGLIVVTNRTQFAIEENIDSMTDREIGAWILAETIKQKEIDLNLRSINIQFAEHVRRNLSFAEANFCAGEDVILEKIFRLLGNDESEKAGYLFRNLDLDLTRFSRRLLTSTL